MQIGNYPGCYALQRSFPNFIFHLHLFHFICFSILAFSSLFYRFSLFSIHLGHMCGYIFFFFKSMQKQTDSFKTIFFSYKTVRSTGFILYMYIDFLMKMAALVLRDLCNVHIFFCNTGFFIQLILLENQIFYFDIVYIEFKEFYFILRYMNGVQLNCSVIWILPVYVRDSGEILRRDIIVMCCYVY